MATFREVKHFYFMFSLFKLSFAETFLYAKKKLRKVIDKTYLMELLCCVGLGLPRSLQRGMGPLQMYWGNSREKKMGREAGRGWT